MKHTSFRHGSILLAGFAAVWLFAGCGSGKAIENVGGENSGGGEIASTMESESSHALTSNDSNTGELNIATSTGSAAATAGNNANSNTTTNTNQTATYTNALPITVSPAQVTTTATPTFAWTTTPVYKIYVTAANSTTIKWGLKCATGSNCIGGPVNLGAQAVTGGGATPIGTASANATLAAGSYNVVVEIVSATGTIAQTGWAAFTVQ